MEKMLLVFLLMLTGAAQAAPPYAFEQFWVHSQPQNSNFPGGTMQVQISRRMMPVGDKAVAVATMTTTEMKYSGKLDKPEVEADKIVKLFQSSYQIKAWKSAAHKNYTAYEGLSAASNQLVELNINATSNHMKMSLVTMDEPYLSETFFESSYLQQKMWNTPTKSASVWVPFFMNEARAGFGDTVANSIGSFLSNTDSQISQYGSSVNSWLGSSQKDVNSVAKSAGSIANTFASLPTDVNNDVSKITNTGNSLSNSIGQYANTGKMIKEASAITAAVTVTATVASAGTQMLMDLGAKGFMKAWYALTGNLPPDIRQKLNDQSNAAMEDIGPLSEKIYEMNLRTNQLLTLLQAQDGKTPTAEALEDAINAKTRMLNDAKEQFNKMSNADSNKQQCYAEINSQFSSLVNLQASRSILQKLSMSHLSPCDEYQAIKAQLGAMQLKLANERDTVLDTLSMVEANIAKSALKTKSDLSDSAATKDCNDLRPDDPLTDDQKQIVDRLVAKCIAAAARRKNIDPEKVKNEKLQLVDQYTDSLDALDQHLMQGICKEQTKDCLSGTSDLNQMISLQNAGLTSALKKCAESPGSPVKLTSKSDEAQAQAAAKMAAASDKPLGDQVATEGMSKPGFFSRLFSSIKSALGFS